MNDQQRAELLEHLMLTHGNELIRLAFSFVKNEETAKDITQNTFVKCYKHLHTYEHKASYKTWLYRIAINECKDYLKSWHYRKVQFKNFIQDSTNGSPSTEQVVLHKTARHLLKDQIFSLPMMYREVIFLFYYDGLTTEEIAEILNLSRGTVKTRLRRGRQKLQLVLEEVEYHA